MKTFRFFLTGIVLLCCSAIYAYVNYDFTVDGIYYKISGTNATVSSQYYLEEGQYGNYRGDVVIPEKVEFNGTTYNVTSIGDRAFYNCFDLTSVTIPNSVTSIGGQAFYECYISSIIIPNSVTRIGGKAFYNCYNLESITIPKSLTSIEWDAFYNCFLREIHIEDIAAWCKIKFENEYSNPFGSTTDQTNLYLNGEKVTDLVIPNGVTNINNYTFYCLRNLISITIPNSVKSIGEKAFMGCISLTEISIPNSVTSIGHSAFFDCWNLTSISIPNSVTCIGDSAFSYCNKLTEITIPKSVTSIGYAAFSHSNDLERIYLLSEQLIGYRAFSPTGSIYSNEDEWIFIVPESLVETYRAAEGWSRVAPNITGTERFSRSIEVTASNSGSTVRAVIGDTLVAGVVDLTIKGTINSYDIIVLNQKMPILSKLDLSEATIVACDYPYYNGNCTENNTLGRSMFSNKSLLRKVVLPKNLIGTLGGSAFAACTNLRNITIHEGISEIGGSAFKKCESLSRIIVPEGVTTISSDAFSYSGLTSIQLPKTLKEIESSAFSSSELKEIILPPSLESIGRSAFSTTDLTEIRLPSSLKSIGDNAFGGTCPLKKVYSYTILPLAISDGTFSNAANAELYLPETSSENYYFAAGWNSFVSHTTFNEPYEYFYLNQDYILNDNTGYIEGEGDQNPDADINPGGGLIVEGEQEDSETPNQSLGDVNVENDGAGNSGSIMGDNNLWVDNLNIKINVEGGRWYFFAFPFDIKLDKIALENGSRCVWRYYDGEERANGKTGWKDVNGNKLNAAQGYIFQSSADDVLVLNIEGIRFKKEDKYNELVAHMSDNLKDASWNFMGNPYLSYYDLNDMEYSAPVTVWDGSKYVAIRPGDDDYHFTPFEAFFVQKPEGESNVGFDGDAQMTQTQSKDKKANQAATRKMMVMNARAKENPRKLVNLTLTAGEATDGTRIVFNNAQSRAYESACDAAKFETQGVIQLFTIGDQQERYAINERPADNGIVMLGFTAPSAGEFSISASRMDTPVYLKDRETGALVDLSKGAYNFTAKAGTNVNRFEVLMEATVTGINQVGTTEGEDAKVYDLGGRRVKENGKGVYIINSEKTLVK